MNFEIIVYIIIGISVLLMAFLPNVLKKKAFSYPILFMISGFLLFRFGSSFPDPDPLVHKQFTVKITELAVIISLMGASLKCERKFSISGWKLPLRLATFTMLLCITSLTLSSYFLTGLSLSSALLLAAVLAPTDPVLASDVQASPPLQKSSMPRFTLTAEAGLNDGTAFPFTWLAILAAINLQNTDISWIGRWFLYDLLYRVSGGILIGVATGWLLSVFVFRVSGKKIPEIRDGFFSVAVTFLSYGLAEAFHTYGFLAVFCAGIAFRSMEREHEYHRNLHDYAEQLEHILMLIVLLLLGGSIARGLLDHLTWKAVILSLIYIFIIRPVFAFIMLWGNDIKKTAEKAAVSFFGIRGIGSLFYLAFALNETGFEDEKLLWSTVAFTITFSIFIHGITASPVMEWLKKKYPDIQEEV